MKKLDDLGIANNTIVIYTTDNGAEAFSWPDGGTTPFRGEKNTNWEPQKCSLHSSGRFATARNNRYGSKPPWEAVCQLKTYIVLR